MTNLLSDSQQTDCWYSFHILCKSLVFSSSSICTPFNHFSWSAKQNLVRIGNARQAVGNHQYGLPRVSSARACCIKCSLRIGEGGCLVNTTIGAFFSMTCQHDTLLFATGEISSFGSVRVFNPRQTVDNLAALCHVHSTVYFVQARIGITMR